MSTATDDTIRFAEKVLTLLDEGSFSATYKYAVLLALMDLCLEQTQKDGDPPNMVTTQQLAEKVVELYWPQAAPFEVEADCVLRQNTGGQAAIVGLVAKFRRKAGADIGSTLHRARMEDPKGFARLVRNVEWKLVEMPLPRVQRVGQQEDCFIYQIAWGESIRRGEWSDEANFDNRIHFVGNAADHLVRLAGLLRPLIQRQWSGMVARINKELVPDSKLDEFLFGVSRVALQSVRTPLRELQNNICFYCEERLPSKVEVDHFMPWARFPDNGLDNLVVAHGRCNNAKRDFLAASEHVAHWAEHIQKQKSQIEQIAQDCRWERDPNRTIGVIRGVYHGLPNDIKLWSVGKTFVELNRAEIADALSGL